MKPVDTVGPTVPGVLWSGPIDPRYGVGSGGFR